MDAKHPIRNLVYERMTTLASCTVGTIDVLNEMLPSLENDEIDPNAIAFQTDEFRAMMKETYSGQHIAMVLYPNGQTMHRRFYCWYVSTEHNKSGNAWMILTHRHPDLFTKGKIMRPDDFTKSMALLQTMETK